MKINSIFFRIFSGFLIIITLFSIILLVSYNWGLSSAIKNWSNYHLKNSKSLAKSILLGNEVVVPQDNPIFVYNLDRELIFSNRGLGRKSGVDQELEPILSNNILTGYYYSPRMQFLDIEANKEFTKAITKALILALIISTIIATIIALLFSVNISRSTQKIVRFLKRLSKGDSGSYIKVEGSTEVQEIINAINNLSRELLREEELRSQWSRDIAHDLRTPIAALKAQFEGMESGVLDINIGRIKQNIKEVYRLEYMVEDLSELMKLEDPKTSLYIDEINTLDLINQIKIICVEDINKKKIKTSFNSSLTSFIGDEMLLYRGISNIWVNAVRHTNVGGSITFSIYQQDMNIIIDINNSGEIIPKNEISRIFDRLYRGEKSRSSQGSGLGLTICQQVVNLHNGDITVCSDKSTGTTFSIKLPL